MGPKRKRRIESGKLMGGILAKSRLGNLAL